MDNGIHLKETLQLQLASDSYAVLHLPFILQTLSKEDFLPSPHTLKWTARINSLIHAKDPAVKWSGLCLAFQTAALSRDILLECAQSWVGAAMPLLVNQPLPTTKAAIRLLRHIFSSAMDVPEFQRQLCVPNVPKYVGALIAILEKESSVDASLLAIDTMVHVVSLYPSLCRPLHSQLTTVALRSLDGSATMPLSEKIVCAYSQLYAVLPLTGGRVNASNLWRKSLDDTVAFAWGAFLQVRTTYPDRGYGIPHPPPSSEDPIIAVPLALDRLRIAARVIGALLRTSTSRPISLPVGSLVRLCSALLQCISEDKGVGHADHVVHALEASIIPTLWKFACEILVPLSKAGRHHLTPHLPPLLNNLAYHLEQSQQKSEDILRFLRTTQAVLGGSHLHDGLVASRLVRATLPKLAIVLSNRSQMKEQASGQSRCKKGKGHVRGYEGDEFFKVGRQIVCVTVEEGDVLLVSVDLLESLLRQTPVNAPTHSIASRLVLAMYASLPQLPPNVLSLDPSLLRRLSCKLQRLCMGLSIGTTSTMSQSVGLVLNISNGALDAECDPAVQAVVDLLVHPRVPPLVRSLPHVEVLSLFRAEEGEVEAETRKTVGLDVLDERSSQLPDASVRHTQQEAEWIRLQQSAPQVVKSPGESHGSVAIQMDVPSMTLTESRASRDSPISVQLERLSPKALFETKQPTTRLNTQSSWLPPPPPDPLLSNSAAIGMASNTASIPPVAQDISIPSRMDDDDDDDEPMPTIDIGSDSESESG